MRFFSMLDMLHGIGSYRYSNKSCGLLHHVLDTKFNFTIQVGTDIHHQYKDEEKLSANQIIDRISKEVTISRYILNRLRVLPQIHRILGVD